PYFSFSPEETADVMLAVLRSSLRNSPDIAGTLNVETLYLVSIPQARRRSADFSPQQRSNVPPPPEHSAASFRWADRCGLKSALRRLVCATLTRYSAGCCAAHRTFRPLQRFGHYAEQPPWLQNR